LSKWRNCVFFDRDGIVNEPAAFSGYIECWRDFRLIPEFVDIARLAVERGYAVALATNQRAVARGIMTSETLEDIHTRLTKLLKEKHGVTLLDIYCCTHERDSCGCRKPHPGMLLRAADDHAIDLSSSWMIGDNETDVEAGNRAGCRTILVGNSPTTSRADYTVHNMEELKNLAGTVF